MVKWNLESDHKLIIGILQTSEVNVNYKAVADTWPKEDADRPTPRAISERLIKIRSMVKARGGPAFAVASSQSPGKAARAPRTPRSRAAGTAARTPKSTTGTKRKRGGKATVKQESPDSTSDETPIILSDDDNGNDDDDEEAETDHDDEEKIGVTTKEEKPVTSLVKAESKPPSSRATKYAKTDTEVDNELGDDDSYDDGTPTKRLKAREGKFQSDHMGLFANDGDYGHFASAYADSDIALQDGF